MGCGTSNDVVPNDQPTENDKSQFPRSPNLKRGKYRFQDFSILLNKINDLKINQFLLFFSQTFSRYRLSNSFRSSVRRPGNRGEKASATKTAAPAGTAEPRAWGNNENAPKTFGWGWPTKATGTLFFCALQSNRQIFFNHFQYVDELLKIIIQFQPVADTSLISRTSLIINLKNIEYLKNYDFSKKILTIPKNKVFDHLIEYLANFRDTYTLRSVKSLLLVFFNKNHPKRC